ncbi:MAG: 4-(cytidine 5'-diphospho)-2-C-methyl-D-erythritol kinase [Dehalococcoidales bacterium]
MLSLKAPAKINLTLEVLRKRPDGFHEIRSVLQTIDLCDTLHIQAGSGLSIQASIQDWKAEKSLVNRVLSLFPASLSRGVDIKIEKRIPLLSGLGGDSSDAAALLKGLNDLWQLKLSPEKLLEMASQLGSDVAFFLQGGTALAEGRGEILTPLPPPKKMWLVLVVPDIPVAPGKTAKMYAALKPSHFTDGAITAKLAETLKKGGAIGSELLFNVFEDIAFDMYPKLSYYISGLIRLGIPVHLAGSGPTLFAVCQDKTQAEELCVKCKEHKATAYMVATL